MKAAHTTTPDTVLYIRVSSEDQNTARQVEDLKKNAGSDNYLIIEEKVSGSVPAMDRRLNEVFSIPSIKRVVVKDLDRLGRDTLDILTTIKAFSAKGVNVVISSLGVSTLLDNGKENPTAKIVFSVLSTLAEMEREKIRERQAEGIAIAKREGKFQGRPKGATNKANENILKKYPKVVKELKAGLSLRKVSTLTGVSVNTVRKVKSEIA